MTCWNDYISVDYKCTYQPCGHTESRMHHNSKAVGLQFSDKAQDFCPKCKLFTLKPVNPFNTLEVKKAMDKIAEEFKRTTMKGKG